MVRSSMLLVISCILLIGCATSEDFSQFEGETIGALIQKSGAPDAQRDVAGLSVYTWETWYAIQGTSYQCKFEATTRKGFDRIINIDVNGNLGGCNRLASKMNL